MNESSLRLINIRYLNSIPYRALKTVPTFSYQEGLPVECAATLLQRDAELGLLPFASIVKHGLYDILPYGIVAYGPVESVLLFSEVELEELESISLDVSSETSVILLKTLIYEFYPKLIGRLKFRVSAAEEVLNQVRGRNGGFIIGDQGLRNASRFAFTMDLAAEWKKRTDLPFLFAAWAYRPGTLSLAQRERFSEAVEIGLAHRVHYARDWAETQNLNREEAMRYVGEVISYSITPEVREGAAEFIERAARHNLLPSELIRRFRGKQKPSARLLVRSLLSKETLAKEALRRRRLSIQAAMQLVEELPLAELVDITARARPYSNNPPLYFLSLCDSGPNAQQRNLSPDVVLERVNRVPEGSLLLLESLSLPELTLDFFEELISLLLKEKDIKLAALSPTELGRLWHESTLSLPGLLARLRQTGLSLIGGVTPDLLCGNDAGKMGALEYAKLQRAIADAGFMTISNIRLPSSPRHLEDYAIHLYHLRQVQDQTSAITLHLLDVTPRESLVFDELSGPGWYLKLSCLSRLLLDNVNQMVVSPRVFGTPVAEVISGLLDSDNDHSTPLQGTVIDL